MEGPACTKALDVRNRGAHPLYSGPPALEFCVQHGGEGTVLPSDVTPMGQGCLNPITVFRIPL